MKVPNFYTVFKQFHRQLNFPNFWLLKLFSRFILYLILFFIHFKHFEQLLKNYEKCEIV